MRKEARPHDRPGVAPHRGGHDVVRRTGRVAVQPDVADLRLGVSINRPTVDAASTDAAATMDAILAAVEAPA